MKNQVTSIGQSKRLIELGVPAEKASMVWEMDEDCARLKIWNTDKETRRALHNKYPNYYVPAFTVADLLGLLPSVIFIAIRFNPTLEKTGEDGWDFEFGQISEDEEYGFARNKSLIDLPVGRIEWVMSNGYKLNL